MRRGTVVPLSTVRPHPAPDHARRLEPAGLGDHLDRLYRAAWAMCGCREDAEDLVQETYAGVLARPRFLHGQADLAYMLGALRKNFLVKLRTERRRPRTWAAGDELEAVAGGSAHSDQAAHEARQVLAAVASLPAEFRDAVIAVDLVGLSYREAARALCVREGTVRSRLFRGRQGVAERLG